MKATSAFFCAKYRSYFKYTISFIKNEKKKLKIPLFFADLFLGTVEVITVFSLKVTFSIKALKQSLLGKHISKH